MKTLIDDKKVNCSVKAIIHKKMVATLRWSDDCKVYVSYANLFNQTDDFGVVDLAEIQGKIRNFCSTKDLILWSY